MDDINNEAVGLIDETVDDMAKVMVFLVDNRLRWGDLTGMEKAEVMMVTARLTQAFIGVLSLSTLPVERNKVSFSDN